MPLAIERARWTRQPPAALAELDRTGYWMPNLRSVISVEAGGPWDVLRMQRLAPSALTGRIQKARRGPRVGDYRSMVQTNTVSYSAVPGSTGFGTTTSVTLLAILTGTARTTLTVRAQFSNVVGGAQYPGILEGDGTSNVWGARVRMAGATDVTAWSTQAAPADGQARVLIARFTSGTGIDLFLDGELVASAATTAALNTTPSTLQPIAGVANVDPSPLTAVWSYAMPDHLIRALSENPWQMFRPEERFTYYTASTGANLDIADAVHSHTAEAAILTQAHVLGVSDIVHVHQVDAVALTQTHVLLVQEADHGHAVDGVALTQQHALAVSDSSHGHAADEVGLSVAGALSIADAAHAQMAGALTLSQMHVLTVDDAAHTHVVEALALSVVGALSIADALHAHAADAVSLTQAHTLVVSGAVHQHLADLVALGVPGVITLDSDRVLIVDGAGRVLLVAAASRTLTIPAGSRVLEQGRAVRGLLVAPAARSLSVH